jgi:enoyl-CoA hydratase/carnithine racemase
MTVVKAELTAPAARELVLRAELVDPEKALELGALDELAPGDHVLPRALSVADELAALPRSAYVQIKHQLRSEAIAALEGIGEDPLLDSWMAPEAGEAASGILGDRP